MREILFATLTAIALVAVSPVAQNSGSTGQRVYGAGSSSCGRWTKDLADLDFHAIELSWVQGFVTGVGTARHAVLDKSLRVTDMDGMKQFVTDYCAKNPLRDISAAAVALTVELAKP